MNVIVPVIALLAASASAAGAQRLEASSADLVPAPEMPEPAPGEIVVTAQRRTQRLVDVPISVTTQSAEQLEAAGVVSTRELTRVVPGLVFAQNESYAQPSIRGVTTSVSTPAAESPNAIYLDGVYIPAQSGALFDLPDVERIEVLKGPQGTLFGRNATGGAIQIFTREPGNDLTGRITVSDGVYTGGSARTSNEVNITGFLSTPLAQDFAALSLSGYYRRNQGYMTNIVDGSRSGKQDSWGVRGKLLLKPAPNVTLLLSGYFNRLFDEAIYNRAPLNSATVVAVFADGIFPTRPRDVATFPETPNFLRLKTSGASLKGTVDTDIGTVTSITGYTRSVNNNFVNSRAGISDSCFAALRCAVSVLNQTSKAVSQEITLVTKKFDVFSLTTGLFYFHNFGSGQDVQQYAGVARTRLLIDYNDVVKTTAYAAFAELNADVTDRLHLIVGGRYSYEKKTQDSVLNGTPVAIPSRSDDAFTPRVSVRYDLADRANTYFTYSRGFKSGLLPPSFQNPKTTVAPEKLTAYEVGFKISRRLFSFNAAYFHYDYTNLQLQQFTSDSLQIPTNAGKAEMDGFDIDSTLRASGDLTLNAAFNYTPRAKFTDYRNAPLFSAPPAGFGVPLTTNGDATGRRLQRVPRFSGSVGVTWAHDYDFGRLGASTSLYHSSASKFDIAGAVTARSYEDVTAQLFYEKRGVRLSLWGKNLLNRAVVTGAQPSATALPVVYNAPRQIGATAGFSF